MIGSELAPYSAYLADRAVEELDVAAPRNSLVRRLGPAYVRVFGVPEVGVQIRAFHVMKRLPPNVGRYLDIGCGAGMLIGAVARRRRFSSLHGIDPDSSSIALARQAHPGAEFEHCAAAAMTERHAGRYDVATCVDVLEHISDAELPAFADACSRVLAPGGRLVVHVPAAGQERMLSAFRSWSHHDHERDGFTKKQFAAVFDQSALRLRSMEATFGRLSSLAWELNMLCAMQPWQAPAFPALLGLALAGEAIRSRQHGNGWIGVWEKP